MTSSTPPEEVSKDVSSDDTTATTRALITRLYDEREAMEKEMAAISARLSRDGAPGMRGALVDDEGFPIPDVDLYAVRADRGRYATLRNDHDDIPDALARAMASLHAVASATRGVGAVDVNATMNPRAARVPSERVAARPADAMTDGESAAGGVAAFVAAPRDPRAEPPAGTAAFAVVDEMHGGSPAASAGLRLHDRVIAFGGVERGAGATFDIVFLSSHIFPDLPSTRHHSTRNHDRSTRHVIAPLTNRIASRRPSSRIVHPLTRQTKEKTKTSSRASPRFSRRRKARRCRCG
jgi:26S proteasome non-ATPase regulatory subunit 9